MVWREIFSQRAEGFAKHVFELAHIAGTGVFNFEQGAHRGAPARSLGFAAGAERDGAVRADGVGGVLHQVDEHLLELGWVGVDERVGEKLLLQLDVGLAQLRFQQGGQLTQRLRGAQRAWVAGSGCRE